MNNRPRVDLAGREQDTQHAKLEKEIQRLQQLTLNKALADQLPSWDLAPPTTLIRRRSTKLL